jgi:hypothetical protein
LPVIQYLVLDDVKDALDKVHISYVEEEDRLKIWNSDWDFTDGNPTITYIPFPAVTDVY